MNWIVALSNLPVIYPIYRTFTNKDFYTMASIGFVGSMSFLSHLVENHKHGMSGIGFSTQTSYYLNRLDVFGSILTGSRFAYLYYRKFGFTIDGLINNPGLCLSTIISFLCLCYSEYDKYNPSLMYTYVISHCVWHISIYSIMDYFLNNVIYS